MRLSRKSFINLSLAFWGWLGLGFFLPSPVSAQSPDQCSNIGNNTAAVFSSGGFSEANYTLALYTGPESESSVISAINSYPGSVIVRLGAGTAAPGPSVPTYVESLGRISSATDYKPFIAMISHNEANCAEHPLDTAGEAALRFEELYAQGVASGIRASGLNHITMITGQVDWLCDHTAFPPPKSPPSEYISRLTSIPGVSGVSLPFYTGDAGDPYTMIAGLEAAMNASKVSDVYITESGPFKRGSALPSDAEFLQYIQGVQQVVQNPRVRALLLFNALGLNPDSNFQYTSRFWNAQCREAFRTQCMDPDAVLAACNGQGPLVTGPHTCFNNFCSGTIHNPCRYTPQLDCSYPVDMGDFLSMSVTPEVKQYATEYLEEYIPMTRVGRGLPFDFEVNIIRQDYCDPASATSVALSTLCSQQTGEGFVEFNLDNLSINALLEPDQGNGNIINIRRDYATGTINHPISGSNVDEPGTVNKLMPREWWAERISAMVDLKEYCWNVGRVPISKFVTHNYFGQVRCMNYQKFPGNLGNERDLFIGGFLNSCRQIHKSNGNRKRLNTEECLADMESLYKQNRPLWEAVFNLPIVPYATFPVFGAIDQLGAESLLQPDRNEADKSNVQTNDFSLPINKTGEFVSGLGDLGTTYYVFPLTSGLDVYQSSFALAEQLLPQETLGDLPDRFPQTCSNIFCSIVNIISNLLQGALEAEWLKAERNDPYWYSRIPEDRQNDGRYRLLQFQFFRNAGACLLKLEDIDRTLKDTPVKATGSDGNIQYQVPSNNANITDLIGALKDFFGQIIPPFVMESYIVCELYPKFLVDSDNTIKEVTKIFSVLDDIDLVTSFEDELPTGKLGSVADDSSPDFETEFEFPEGCKFNPPGFGDNQGSVVTDPNTGQPVLGADGNPIITGTSSACWYGLPDLESYGYFCGTGTQETYGSYIECPDEDSATVQAFLNTQPGKRDLGEEGTITPPGGGLTTFNLGLFLESHVINPHAWEPYVALPDEDLNWLCNRCRDSGQCPTRNRDQCAKFIYEPPKQDDTPSGGSCGFSGGFPLASSAFRDVIAGAAEKHNVPPQLIMAMIQGENCRFTSGARNVCNISSANYFQPGIEYPGSDNCSTPGSGTDAAMNNQYKGMFRVFLFAHHQNGWGANRDSSYTNVCSINDMTYATAKVLKSANPGATSPNWSRTEIDRAIVRWVTGLDLPTGCNTGIDDLPNTPASVWTDQVKQTAVGAINIFCGYINQLNNPSSSVYMDAQCN